MSYSEPFQIRHPLFFYLISAIYTIYRTAIKDLNTLKIRSLQFYKSAESHAVKRYTANC